VPILLPKVSGKEHIVKQMNPISASVQCVSGVLEHSDNGMQNEHLCLGCGTGFQCVLQKESSHIPWGHRSPAGDRVPKGSIERDGKSQKLFLVSS
jgi:hypothetical protein